MEGVNSPDGASEPRQISYDQLVLALGSVPNYLGMPNVERRAFNFKAGRQVEGRIHLHTSSG